MLATKNTANFVLWTFQVILNRKQNLDTRMYEYEVFYFNALINLNEICFKLIIDRACLNFSLSDICRQPKIRVNFYFLEVSSYSESFYVKFKYDNI